MEQHRAALSAIQCVSQDFRGFSEAQLDELLPFLDFIEFTENEEVVTTGEDASWFGLLLGGQLDVKSGSTVLATLNPGRIVGEMAFFRGGKRGASMVGAASGTIAILQFASMPRLFDKDSGTATNMVRAMGRAAVRKMELTQDIIPRTSESVMTLAMGRRGSVSGSGGGGGGGNFDRSRFDKAIISLEKRGLSSEEVSKLLDAMRLLHFHAGQNIMLREHTVQHFGIVLHGTVEQGYTRKKTAQPGDLVGEYEVLSGHPFPASAIGGPSGGVIGMLALDLSDLNDAGKTTPPRADSAGAGSSGVGGAARGLLAMKLYKLLGISATSVDNAALDEAAGSMLRESDSEMQAKQVEVIYRERVRREKEKAVQAQEALDQEKHRGQNSDILLRKAQKEKAAALSQNASLSEELKKATRDNAKLSREKGKLQEQLSASSAKVDELQRMLELTDAMQEVLRLRGENGALSAELDHLRKTAKVISRRWPSRRRRLPSDQRRCGPLNATDCPLTLY